MVRTSYITCWEFLHLPSGRFLATWCLNQNALVPSKQFPDWLRSCAGQLPGERQRFRVLGPTRTYTTSQSWIEVSYADLTHNAGKVLYHLGSDVTPLAIVQGNGYGHGAFLDIPSPNDSPVN